MIGKGDGNLDPPAVSSIKLAVVPNPEHPAVGNDKSG